MAKDNKKKVKEPVVRTEESEAIHRFILLFVVIIVVVIIIYLISSFVVNKREDKNKAANESLNTNVKIDYNIASVGTILNRPYDNYYVMVYDGNDDEAIYYSSLINKFQQDKEHKKIYFMDLSEPVNSAYAKTPSNPSAQTIQDLAFGKVTLLEISKGKITNYVEDIEKIKDILQ